MTNIIKPNSHLQVNNGKQNIDSLTGIISDLNLMNITGFTDLKRRMAKAINSKIISASYPRSYTNHFDPYLSNLINLAMCPKVTKGFIQRNQAINYAARKDYDISMLNGLAGIKTSDLTKPYYKHLMYKSIFWELYKKYYPAVRIIAKNGSLSEDSSASKILLAQYQNDLKLLESKKGGIISSKLIEMDIEKLDADYSNNLGKVRSKHYLIDINLAAYMLDREQKHLSHYTQSHTILLACIGLLMKTYKSNRANKTPAQKMITLRAKNYSGIRKKNKGVFISKYRSNSKYKKYTNKQLSEEFGCHRNTVAKWKNEL